MKRGPDNGILIVACSLVFLGGLLLSFALVHPDLGTGSTVTSVVVARGGGRVPTPTLSVPTGSFTTPSVPSFTQPTSTTTGPPIVTAPSTGATSFVTITQPQTITSVITTPGQGRTTTILQTVTITTTTTQTQTTTGTTTTQTTQTTQTTDTSAAAGLVVFKTAKPTPCTSCHTFAPAHSSSNKGPNLNSLKALWVDSKRLDGSFRLFIQQSITDPGRTYLPPGFGRTMPAYTLSQKQLTDLVHFIFVHTN